MPETDPTTSEVLQDAESDLRAVPVNVAGPVFAQILPAPDWTTRRHAIAAGETVKVANGDPRRQRLVLQTSAEITIGKTQAEAVNSGFVIRSIDPPIPLHHYEEVWAFAAAAAVVTAFHEMWTE